MHYQGGKHRIARQIAAVVLRHTTDREVYFEPFLGGGNVAAALAPAFRSALLSDLHPDLIAMWDALLLRGWIPPREVSEEEYARLKAETEPSPLRGFAGFACSFGGKFMGTYARCARGENYADAAASQLARKAGAIRRCETVDVARCDFRGIAPGVGAVVYCDPPYAGTSQSWGYAERFPSDAFWRTLGTWARRGAAVFVSEYQAPQGWREVWNMEVSSRLQGGTVAPQDRNGNLFAAPPADEAPRRIERLFTWDETNLTGRPKRRAYAPRNAATEPQGTPVVTRQFVQTPLIAEGRLS